jgi:hypothetical protein
MKLSPELIQAIENEQFDFVAYVRAVIRTALLEEWQKTEKEIENEFINGTGDEPPIGFRT